MQLQKKGPVKRKQVRNPEKTRNNLLRAGIRLFSERGYTGVAVDEIVATAGCNKRMLYHYYENKDGLYVAVLESVFSRLERMEIEFLREESDLGKCLENLMEQYFAFLEENPEFVHLLMWENLNRAQFLSRHPQLLSKNPVVAELQRILKKKHQNIGAQHLIIQLYSVCFIYQSNKYTLTHTMGLDLHDPKVRRAGIRQAARLMLEGLR